MPEDVSGCKPLEQEQLLKCFSVAGLEFNSSAILLKHISKLTHANLNSNSEVYVHFFAPHWTENPFLL